MKKTIVITLLFLLLISCTPKGTKLDLKNVSQTLSVNEVTNYKLPENANENKILLKGPWLITNEEAEAKGKASIVIILNAKKVYLQGAGEAKIFFLSQPIKENAGKDITNSTLKALKSEFYELVNTSLDKYVLELKTEKGFKFKKFILQ